MFERERSPEALLSRPVPERYRLAGALVKRALGLLDKPAGDNERAKALLESIAGALDDPTDIETLDDAIERCVDALTADPQFVPALVTAGTTLIQYAWVEGWTHHPRPLRDARKLLERALELAPKDETAFEGLLRCELFARRFEPAGDYLNDIKDDPALDYTHALGRGLWFAMHEIVPLRNNTHRTKRWTRSGGRRGFQWIVDWPPPGQRIRYRTDVRSRNRKLDACRNR